MRKTRRKKVISVKEMDEQQLKLRLGLSLAIFHKFSTQLKCKNKITKTINNNSSSFAFSPYYLFMSENVVLFYCTRVSFSLKLNNRMKL